MQAWVKSLIMLTRLAWLCALAIGVWIITGHGFSLMGAHIAVGFGVVLLMVLLLVTAALRGAGWMRPLLALIFAIALPVVGFGQLAWHAGSAQWMIQLFHILIAIIALGFAEMLAAARRGRANP